VRDLFDELDLAGGFAVGTVLGGPAARDALAARLRERGPFLAVEPEPAQLRALPERLKALPPGRPVVWVEAPRFSVERWSGCLAAMNHGRDWMVKHVPAMVLLAGPPELGPLSVERPDLASIMGPWIELRQGPGAPLHGLGRLRWLHVSDLHFQDHKLWTRRAVLQGLLRFVREDLAGEGLLPDLVFVTGDIADKGLEAEYRQAEEFLGELVAACGLEARQRLFLVPGNHDVDRGRIGYGRYLSDGLLRSAQGQDFDPDEIEQVLGDPLATGALAQRLEAFYAFTARLLGPHAWSPGRPWRADPVEVEGCGVVGVLQLNSAWASGPGDARGRLLLGEAQLRQALAELPAVDLRVALVHHPADWLAEGDRRGVEGVLFAPGGPDFLLRGHLHDNGGFVRSGPDGACVELAAGATYVKKGRDKGCMLVELDGASARGRVHFLGYSGKGRGHWSRDSGLYERSEGGVWEFSLPAHLSQAEHARSPGAAPPPSASSLEALTSRYRASVAARYGTISFLGLSERSKVPRHSSVADLFVPLDVAPRGAGDDSPGLGPGALVRSLLERDGQGRAARLVLLGDPGSGKTTLCQAMSVWAAGGMPLGDEPPHRALVPLLIKFRAYLAERAQRGRLCLLDYLVGDARDTLGHTRDSAFFEGLLQRGQALVLLDGLDEVSEPGQREDTLGQVRTFAQQYPQSPVLVTSRVVGYDEAPLPDEQARREALLHEATDDGPRPFRHLRLRPLSPQALSLLVERWYAAREPGDRDLRRRLTADLQGALAAPTSKAVRALATNPLLATLICLVHGHRAQLPGQRVELYHEVVETLLDTWVRLKKGTADFKDLDPNRQRGLLQRLAHEMQKDRAENEQSEEPPPDDGNIQPGILVRRAALVERLVVLEGRSDDPDTVRTQSRRMQGWVRWLAERTGLLVEQRPGWFGFLHLTLQEYLAACDLDERRGAEGVQALVTHLAELAPQPTWRETVSLVLGRRADDKLFIEALVEDERGAFEGRQPLHDRVLADALREELDLSATRRRALVGRVLPVVGSDRGQRTEALASLAQVARLSPRHGDGLRADVAEVIQAWPAAQPFDTALLQRLPDLLSSAPSLLAATDRLRPLTRDGELLFWLWEALDLGGRRWPKARREVRLRLARFFDHVPAEDRQAVLATMAPWWREIPAGSFLMGSDEGEGHGDERPQHRVEILHPFWMLAVPVTWAMYERFDPGHRERRSDFPWSSERWNDAEPCPAESQDDHPVNAVSWHAAVSFARWLGARLPAEAEWEYACRAGSDTPYWSGDREEDLLAVGWIRANSRGHTHPVATPPDGGARQHPWGLHDLHGNVWEWCADAWQASYAGREQGLEHDPSRAVVLGDPSAGRMIRGGSWNDGPGRARSAYRVRGHPADRNDSRGFRLVLPGPLSGS